MTDTKDLDIKAAIVVDYFREKGLTESDIIHVGEMIKFFSSQKVTIKTSIDILNEQMEERIKNS